MNTQNFKRRLTAILSADVEGYSRLMRDNEDETVRTITAYRAAIAKLVEQYRGRVVDSPGDNILVEFGSGLDAVNCAVEIQRELAERNAELSENRRMQFRIGVNSGDVIQEDERIYGDGVNIAARIESLAEGGGISISGTVYDSIEGKLGLEFENMGKHEVKNIDKLIRVYRILSFPGAAAHRVVKAKKAVGKTWRNKMIAIASVLVIAGAAWAVWQFELRPTIPSVEPASVEKMAYPLPDKPSIAVLPFENLSDDPAQENIVDGITDAIITGLSRTPEMFVIARNSVFTYKGKPVKVKQVSEDLGVRYVLEGSVQREGDRLRINAQLIDAVKGHHLWAEKYDRDLKGIFALQDEITMKIIKSLQLKLTEGEYARTLAKGTDNIEAYLKCLQAIQIFRRFKKEDNLLSRKMFEEVIALDTNYPIPYIYLGWTHLVDVRYGWSKSPKKSQARAEELAQKALELDDSLGILHRFLADIYRRKRQWDKAYEEAERAVSINPTAMNMYGLAMYLWFAGRPEGAIGWFEKAFRLDPIPPAAYLDLLGLNYFLAKRYEDALELYKRALDRKGELNPIYTHLGLSATYAMLGQEEEARRHATEVLRISPKWSIRRAVEWFQRNFKNPAVADRYIAALRKAGLPEEPSLPLPNKPSIAVLPFANISGDPEQEYFSDGMTDTLITDLSKISELFVIARNSVFTYKGKTVKVDQIGRELGVRYVMEGSVQKAKNQVRINAQLIDTKTGGHLWAERYDGKMDDIFALQDKIINNIVSALAVKLTASEQEQVARKYTDNIEAYDAFLKGEGHFLRSTREDSRKAIPYLKKAIKLDPNYGRAYAVLGLLYWLYPSTWTGVPWPNRTLMARNCLELAMKNPDPSAHRLAAIIKLWLRLYKEAISEAERALALAPNDPGTHAVMAYVLNWAGRPKEAVEYAKFEMRFDPRRVYLALFHLGTSYFSMGKLEEAATYFERSLTHNPELPDASIFLAATYAHLGREKEAREALDNYYSRLRWKPSLGALMYWHPFKDPEVAERFAEGVLKAGMKGEPSGYYKILEENRLSGEEIRKFVFGREFQTSCPLLGQFYVNHTKDGTIMDGERAIGKSRTEDDMLCSKWDSRFEGLEYCGTVFRNPKGTSDTEDEYLYVTDFQICKLSPAERKPILEENRLSGEEIRKLTFGRTTTGFSSEGGGQWWVENSKDGKKIKLWTDAEWTDSGKGWVEGDLSCFQWQKLRGGVKYCFHIYRNPEGTPEKKNEYLSVEKDRITPWSLID